MITISREEAASMAEAHAEGWHSPPEMPREGCPECEGRDLREYRTAAEIRERRAAAAE